MICYHGFSHLNYCISYREAFHFNMVLLNLPSLCFLEKLTTAWVALFLYVKSKECSPCNCESYT